MQPAQQVKTIGLFLGVDASAGGMYQYALSLLEALRNCRPQYEVQIACTSEAWAETLQQYPFQVAYLTQGKLGLKMATLALLLRLPTWLTSRINPLAKQLQQLKCDLWIFPSQDALAYQANVPFMATVHDLMHRYEPHFPEVAGKWRTPAREHRFRQLTKRARAILTDSELGKQQVVESYGTPPVKIYPLPYIAPRYIQDAEEPADFNARYALPKKFFFYPAQFWAHKNHQRLIDAAALLKQTHPDIQLVLTGGKRHAYEEVAAHVAKTGMQQHVSFMGYVPNEYLAGFYRRARALVMPTFFGPTNIPPLEAFSCNCPVAISGIYGMPEQLGDAALYFDPRSVPEMAEAMQKLWSDDALCEQLKQRGAARMLSWGEAQFNIAFKGIIDTLARIAP